MADSDGPRTLARANQAFRRRTHRVLDHWAPTPFAPL